MEEGHGTHEEDLLLVTSDIVDPRNQINGFTSRMSAERSSAETKTRARKEGTAGDNIPRKASKELIMPRLSSEELSGSAAESLASAQGSALDDNLASITQVNGDVSTEVGVTKESEDALPGEGKKEEEPAVKKPGRGRPRKQRGGPPPKTPNSTVSSDAVTAPLSEPTPIIAQPKKAASPVIGKRKTRSSNLPSSSATAVTDAEPAPPAKRRGRGRPKAVPDEAHVAAQPVRKGRAVKVKPRKTVSQEPEDKDDSGGADEEKEWEVEKIVDDLIDVEGTHFFRVKWKGYAAADNSWEPKKNLSKCKQQIEAYQKQKTKEGKKAKK